MMRPKERVIHTQNHCSLHWLSHCQHIKVVMYQAVVYCVCLNKELLIFGLLALKSNAPNKVSKTCDIVIIFFEVRRSKKIKISSFWLLFLS